MVVRPHQLSQVTAVRGVGAVVDVLTAAVPGGRQLVVLRLNPSLPWDVEIYRDVQRLTADLRHTQLTRLAVHGGASHVTFELPPPRGAVSLNFAKGVHQLTIVRPRHTAARVSVHCGASQAH